jgi:hypothetical protein
MLLLTTSQNVLKAELPDGPRTASGFLYSMGKSTTRSKKGVPSKVNVIVYVVQAINEKEIKTGSFISR